MMTTYGYQIKSENDPIIETTAKAIEILANSIAPGAFLVNMFPICMSKSSGFIRYCVDFY
jgi:hypothetical protein